MDRYRTGFHRTRIDFEPDRVIIHAGEEHLKDFEMTQATVKKGKE